MLSRAARRVAALCGAAAAAVAQVPGPQPLPGAGTTVLVVAFDGGLDDDGAGECGLAHVLLECRLQRARAAAPAVHGSGGHVGSDACFVYVQVAAADWSDGLRFVDAMLDDGVGLDDDALRLYAARAALAADDADWLYPGTVLRGLARRALCVGGAARGEAGVAVDLQRLRPATVRAALRRPVGVEVTAFGAIPSELPAALDRRAREHRPARGAPARDDVAPDRPPTEVTRPHRRIDGPFAALAYPVAAADRGPALAVGLEVARQRGARRLVGAAAQVRARAPVVTWSWLEADPIAVFCRRGPDGGAADVPRLDLAAFLDELRREPPSARELERAQRALLGELSPLPWPPALAAAVVRAPDALPGRAVTAVRAFRRGIDRDAVAAVTGDAAHDALRAVLAPAPPFAGALVPSGSTGGRAPGTGRDVR